MRLLGIGFMVASIGIFYGIFFCFAPYVSSCIPAGEWHKLAEIVVYIFLAWIGGVVLPFVLFVSGVFMTAIGRN